MEISLFRYLGWLSPNYSLRLGCRKFIWEVSTGLRICIFVKNLQTIQETWFQFLSQEDPLEMEMVTHTSILSWKIPWTEEPGRLQSMGSQELNTT